MCVLLPLQTRACVAVRSSTQETSAKTDKGGVDEGVYDALVWGIVSTIIDTPGLASHGSSRGQGTALELAEHRRMGGGARIGCC